jgi:hypothetical protein
MAKNKWIFYTAAIAVILLIVILSLALPGMIPKNEGSEKDLHETTGYQEEVTTGKPITVPPETVTETKKETQKETAQTTQETTRRETTQETTREETTPEETTENKPAEKTTSETTKESETVVEDPYIDESDYPTPKDIKAKAVYLNAGAAGTPSVINYIIDLAKNTELNAVVIDIKDGPIAYPSEVKYAKEYGLYGVYYYPDELIAKLHDNDIYVIGRLVCFRDPALAEKKPELAIHTASGEIWKENGTTAWLNPYHPDVQKYLLDLATEAAKKGFDEIQFDYIRFPTGTYGKDYYGENLPSKTEAVEAFLDAAVKALRPYGVKVTADIFGIVGLSQADGYAIGQHLETIGKNIDYICPMVYPSHYANGSNSVMGNGTGTLVDMTYNIDPYGTGTYRVQMIGAQVDDAKLERIFAILQYTTFHSEEIWYRYKYGIEGIHYKWSGEPYVSAMIATPTAELPPEYQGGSLHVFSLFYNPSTVQNQIDNAVKYGFWAYMPFMHAYGLFEKYVMNPEKYASAAYMGYDLYAKYTELNAEVKPQIDAVVKDFKTRALNGEIADYNSEWAQYIDQLYAAGLQKLIDEVFHNPEFIKYDPGDKFSLR